MTLEDKIKRTSDSLADVQKEKARQSEFAGVRFGVFARLKELERDERRLMRRLEALSIEAKR